MFNKKVYDDVIFEHTLTAEVSPGDFSVHHHTEYEILLSIRGIGRYLIEDTEYELTENTMLLIPPGKYHVLKTPPKNNYERYVIRFAESYLPDFLQKPDVIYKSVSEDVRSLFTKFDNYVDSYPENTHRLLLMSLLTETLINLAYDKSHKNALSDTLPDLVKGVINYVSDNIHDKIDLSTISKAFFVSDTYLSHLFQKNMNISLMKYVRIKKMYKAREYLMSGMPAVKTAEILGYVDYPTFFKNYKSFFKISPSKQSKTVKKVT